MSGYRYKDYRGDLFTDDGQRKFLRIRDKVQGLLKMAGAVRMSEATAGVTGLNWEALACVDRMVELGELIEITGPDVFGQDRVFVGVTR